MIPQAFDEALYLLRNPDVQDAVNRGEFESGYAHYLVSGKFENRRGVPVSTITQPELDGSFLSSRFSGYLSHPAPEYEYDWMVHPHEERLLSLAAMSIWDICDSEMLIVDAGCFVGASTMALADGLSRSALTAEAARGKILSYDLFMTTPGMEPLLSRYKISAGQSFRPIYDANILPMTQLVQVIQGDFLESAAPLQNVAVMFVDILWSWEAERHLAKTFYPRLMPGKSILIHQDFVVPFYPWIVLSMGLASDTFRFGYHVQFSSVIFDVLKNPREMPDPRDISLAKAIEIYDSTISKLHGWATGCINFGKAVYLASRGEPKLARAVYQEVLDKFSHEQLVMQFQSNVNEIIKQHEIGNVIDLERLSH